MGYIASTQNGFQLLAIKQIQERDLLKYHTIRRTNIIVKTQYKILLHFNQYQNHWELLNGNRRKLESPLDAIKRGWTKKTGTSIDEETLKLNVLLMVKSPSGEIRYNPIYFLEKDTLDIEANPALHLWDGQQNIGNIDPIHQIILQSHLKTIQNG